MINCWTIGLAPIVVEQPFQVQVVDQNETNKLFNRQRVVALQGSLGQIQRLYRCSRGLKPWIYPWLLNFKTWAMSWASMYKCWLRATSTINFWLYIRLCLTIIFYFIIYKVYMIYTIQCSWYVDMVGKALYSPGTIVVSSLLKGYCTIRTHCVKIFLNH